MKLRKPTKYETLFLHETSLDLCLNKLQKAMDSIPDDVLTLQEGCHLILTDYTHPDDNVMNSGVVLGYGYHHSDFDGLNDPRYGIMFNLNPPYNKEITNVRLHFAENENYPALSTFKVGEERFMISRKKYDLDEVVCNLLSTGERYKKE